MRAAHIALCLDNHVPIRLVNDQRPALVAATSNGVRALRNSPLRMAPPNDSSLPTGTVRVDVSRRGGLDSIHAMAVSINRRVAPTLVDVCMAVAPRSRG